MNDLDLKALWQTASDDRPPVDIEAVKEQAHRFQRKIRRRNALEWLAAGAVVVLFGRGALGAESFVLQLGHAMIVAAAVGIAVFLWRKGRVDLAFDPTVDTQTFVRAHADALLGQARLLATAPLWYVLPIALGVTLLVGARFPEPGSMMWPWLLSTALNVLILAAVAWVNLRASQKLRAEAEVVLATLE